jgi:hypothetical protein
LRVLKSPSSRGFFYGFNNTSVLDIYIIVIRLLGGIVTGLVLTVVSPLTVITNGVDHVTLTAVVDLLNTVA